MRIVLIHGIAQEGRGEALEAEWLGHLRQTVGGEASWPMPPASAVTTAFYGDALAQLTRGSGGTKAVAQGFDDLPNDLDAFAEEALLDMARKAGVSQTAIDHEFGDGAVAQGAGPHKRSLKAIARLIESISPLGGTLALRVLGEAHAYLKRPHVGEQIDDLVRPALKSEGPIVVVSHSLGTVIAFKLLRELADRGTVQCPLLVTLGSPLGIDTVRRSFDLPRRRPEGVARWLNVADPCDFVALRPELTTQAFGAGIENLIVNNPSANPHGIAGYLADARVGAAISDALTKS